jgi:hypothetical protein
MVAQRYINDWFIRLPLIVHSPHGDDLRRICPVISSIKVRYYGRNIAWAIPGCLIFVAGK